MPELPEVETVKRALEKAARGAAITGVEIRCRKLREEIPAGLEQKMTGTIIKSFKRIAKYIIVELDNRHSLIWHLGMSGRVKFSAQRPPVLDKHDHVIIETNRGCIIFNDSRRFGLLTCCESGQLFGHRLLAGIGADPMGKNFSGRYLQQKFQHKTAAVKTVLLDQRIVGGIGNIYASEALYEARILPARPAAELTAAECDNLAAAVVKVLKKAIKAGGSTLKDYRKPDGSTGYFQQQHCVYNKTGQRCPDCTCGFPADGGIQKTVLGGRSTFYCPVLQK